jgi:4-aminobutyrate aminotransferase
LVAEATDGCIVRDVDGNEFIDFCSCLGVMNIGHNHPRVLEAVKSQVVKALHYGYDLSYYEVAVRLSEALVAISPVLGEKRVCYGNSGSEAVEAGMKAAAWHTRGHTFLAFLGSSHGRTIGASSLSSASIVHKRYLPTLVRVARAPFPYCYRCSLGQTYPECGFLCVNVLDDYLRFDIPAEDVAALVFEPVQGEGCVVPPEGFFKRLSRLAREYGLLLLDDEVLTGMGRTGRWFAVENWGISPDIVCVGGSLSSGLPIGAMVSREDVMDWEPGSHASTMGGNPVACAAALATIGVMREEHLLENAVRQGSYIIRRLRELAAKYTILGDVRGIGLLIGVEIIRDPKTRIPYPEGARQIVLKSWRHGVMLQVSGSSTIRLCPPLIISRELVDSSLEVIEAAVSEVEAEL